MQFEIDDVLTSKPFKFNHEETNNPQYHTLNYHWYTGIDKDAVTY